MSELHWVLLGIAAALLIGLYLYGKWQERRALRRLSETMHAGVGDALFDGVAARPSAPPASRHAPPRIEPRFEAAPAVSGDAAAGSPDAGAPAVGEPTADPDPADSERQLRADPGVWVEDPLLDFVVELRCSHAFDGVAALEARAQIDRLALPLPAHVAVWDAKTQQWGPPDRFGFYSEMLIAVQMASRRHVLGDIEASRFIATVQQIAVSIDADLDIPDMARVVGQAAELDTLAARSDVLITVTLLAGERGPWSREEIARALSEHGFEIVVPSQWVHKDPHGRPILTLTTGDAPFDRLSLTLDVPVAPVDAAPLKILFGTARELAKKLSASVVDDNGRPLAPNAEVAIEAELAALYRDMKAAGIEPGGSRARRLYVG